MLSKSYVQNELCILGYISNWLLYKKGSFLFWCWWYWLSVLVVISRLLATCSADQTCKIWRTSNFSLMTELSIKSNNPGETSRGWMWDCAFSGDSQYIVTGQYMSPGNWVIATMRCPIHLHQNHSTVRSLIILKSEQCYFPSGVNTGVPSFINGLLF